MDSKSAAAYLIDPLNAPEPSEETGPGAHLGSTFAPASQINGVKDLPRSLDPSGDKSANAVQTSQVSPSAATHSSPRLTSPSSASSKAGVTSSVRQASSSPRTADTGTYLNYRNDPFHPSNSNGSSSSSGPRRTRAESHGTPPSYHEATSPAHSPTPGSSSMSQALSSSNNKPRRNSSLKQRYPGDPSTEPLEVLRRDSKKAYRSHHLHKNSLPGADTIDRLDPAIGGRAYHHEGPYDAALLARNRDPRTAPVNALQTSNSEALRATPRENIQDAVERHKPLDGVAAVPPGVADQFGRRYQYEEGPDLNSEGQIANLEQRLTAHKIDEEGFGGIELQERPARRSWDYNDDVAAPLPEGGRYRDVPEVPDARTSGAEANASGESHGRGMVGSIKKRIGSLRK